MLWRGRRESENIVDQRSFGPKSLGLGSLLIGAVVYYFMGGNPLEYLAKNINPSDSVSQTKPDAKSDDRKNFFSVVLADTEDVWTDIFRKHSATYPQPKLVLFRGSVDSTCGRAGRSAGPFYCSRDHQVYLDLSFFDELSHKLGA